jgi:predicted nicotinamide N-methyase
VRPEDELRDRFAVRTESFSHAGFAAEILLPRAADELIDVSEFNVDERLPYWAALWPSARALARWLLERGEPPPGPVLELGCGVALPSLALRHRGVDVLATDYYEDALAFAAANAQRNGLSPLRTRLLDWRDPPPDLGRFATVVAADVLYERRNAEALRWLLPAVAAPGARVLVADPGRLYAADFRAAAQADGWAVAEIAAREEPSAEGVVSRVRLIELRAGATPATPVG